MAEENSFKFTESQRKIISFSSSIIKRSLEADNHFILKIIGSAGTGKTTVVSGILHALYKNSCPVSIVAPTHKAVSVIESKIKEYAKNNPDVPFVKYNFFTLASILKMERVYNYETSKTDFVMGAKTDKYALVGHKLVIIDEASMVTKAQYEKFCELAERYNLVVVFLGDIKQLPPVKEKSSPAVIDDVGPGKYSFTLTEIIRQGPGNPILNVAHDLKLVKDFVPHIIDKKGYTYSVDRDTVLKNLSKGEGSDLLKYLAWSNTDVDNMNTDVRKLLHGDYPEDFYVGETVISQSNSVNASNNQDVLIEGICRKPMLYRLCRKADLAILPPKLTSGIKTLEPSSAGIPGIYASDANVFVILDVTVINNEHTVVAKDCLSIHKTAVSILKQLVKDKKISWIDAVNFEDKFFKYKHGYAMTVHKS